MLQKTVSIILLVCFLFQINCATTNKVPVATYDYDKLAEAERIFVTVKSGREYELVAFKFTDTLIEGTAITRNSSKAILTQEKIKIESEDVEFITVEKSEFKWVPFRRGCFIGGGIGIAAAAIVVGVAFVLILYAYSVSG